MYALTYPMDVEIEGSSEGSGEGEEEEEAGPTLLATTEPVVTTTEKHQTSQMVPEHGSFFMSRPSGVPVISGYSSYPYPPPLSYGGYGRPVPAIPRPGYPAFYYQHQRPASPPKYVYYPQGYRYPINRFFG